MFTPAYADQSITTLSSLKKSQALELPCPEGILEIRYNNRIDAIAVNTWNGQTSLASLPCTSLCGKVVKVYEPLSCPATSGIIRYVDAELSDQDITENLRSPQQQVARVRHLGKTPSVKLTFYGKRFPFPFHDQPLQCRKCMKYNHREAVCKSSLTCSRSGESHVSSTCKSTNEKSSNCGGTRTATAFLPNKGTSI